MSSIKKLEKHILVESLLKDIVQFDLKNNPEHPTEYEYYIRNSGFFLTHFSSLLSQIQNAVELLSNYDYSKNNEFGRGKHLVYNIENYKIRIASVNDRLLQLINAIFHLGISDNHVNERIIMKNIKVMNTDIPQKFKDFKKTINDVDNDRNAIIHRHSIMDERLNKIEILYHPELTKDYFSNVDKDELRKIKIVRKKALTDLIRNTKTEFNEQIEECIQTLFPIYDILKIKYDKITENLK